MRFSYDSLLSSFLKSPLKPRTSWEAHWEKTWSHSSLGEEGWQDWFLGVWANLPLRLNARIHGPRLVTLFPEQLSLICSSHQWAFLVAQRVKNLLAMHKTRVWSGGQEDPLEKGMATHSSILAWRIPWTEEPGGLQTMGSQESDMTEWLTLSLPHRLPPTEGRDREHYSGKSMGFGATD